MMVLSFRLEEEESFMLSHMSDEKIEDAPSSVDDEDSDLDERDLNRKHQADELIATFSDIQPSDPTFQPVF